MRSSSDRESGFTIIEVLVALAVVASSVAAISALMANASRSANRLERHVELVETARAIASALPARDRLAGSFSGELSGHHWRVDVLPFTAVHVEAKSPPSWVPQTVVISVRSSDGAAFQMSTVRLRRGITE